MNTALYFKLAKNNIKNHRKIYLPYLLTGMCMVMIFYIISFLSFDKQVSALAGGATLQSILYLGVFVIGIFSVIFLFYTSSFILKRRKKEFGLYNILGMGKRHIARVMVWETSLTALICVGCGLILGIVFSKLTQLMLLKMMETTGDFTVSVDPLCVIITAIIYFGVYFLILLNSLRQIHLSNPIELLRDTSVGEKKPKANWVLAVIGTILLGFGYFLAISVKDSISALTLFFVAVILVILGTFACFIAGSSAILTILKKNKKYYYKTNHFISVSSMQYRMKRNGAGLASICILSTIVLVMLSSVTCLYIGADDAIKERYPRDININLYTIKDKYIDTLNETVNKTLDEKNVKNENLMSYSYLAFPGKLAGNEIKGGDPYSSMLSDSEQVVSSMILPLDDYNKTAGTNYTLSSGEIMVFTNRVEFDSDELKIGENKFTITEKDIPSAITGMLNANITGTMMIVVPEKADLDKLYNNYLSAFDKYSSIRQYNFGIDVDASEDAQKELQTELRDNLSNAFSAKFQDNNFSYSVEVLASQRMGFYSLYGGLFFLGIILGITFIIAAILIMYYKQITEGYEDQSRFEIMQKVGLTKAEIKKSINSQILIVFFMPLLAAGVHIAFAFPMIEKLLKIFNLYNTTLFLIVTAAAFVIFTIFYTVVYMVTSKAYYSIVSEKE